MNLNDHLTDTDCHGLSFWFSCFLFYFVVHILELYFLHLSAFPQFLLHYQITPCVLKPVFSPHSLLVNSVSHLSPCTFVSFLAFLWTLGLEFRPWISASYKYY